MPNPLPATDIGLQLHMLTGLEFEDARHGRRANDHTLQEVAWLLPPEVKYFYDRSVLERDPDTRVFFMLTRKSPLSRHTCKREVVAMLEIANQPADVPTVGLKYISVLDTYRKQGLALQLYSALVEFLQAKGLRLYRTRPGKDTPARFTEAVTRLLEQRQVDWYRR